MTTLEKIRREIQKVLDTERDFTSENAKAQALALFWVLELIDKYAEQEPKTGHWIEHSEHCENLGVIPSGLGAYKWCSNCDCGIDAEEWHRNDYNYCPNCGARMWEKYHDGDERSD